MKKIFSLLFIISFFIITLASCNKIVKKVEGSSITKEYEILEAKEVEISDIYLKNGNNYYGPKVIFNEASTKSVSIQFQEEFSNIIKVEFVNNRLTIKGDRLTRYETNCDFIINISGYKFDIIELRNATNATANGIITNNEKTSIGLSGASILKLGEVNIKDLKATISGASQLMFDNLISNTIDVNLSGASMFKAKGSASSLISNLSGASTLSSKDLVIDTLNVELSGASSMEIAVNNSITGTLSGASNIKYVGNPTVNVELSGASTTSKI